MEDKWGVGKEAKADAFATTTIGTGPGKEAIELIIGEHPHSRQDDKCYARFSNGRIEAFDGHRICVSFQFEAHNYLKTSELSGNEVRKGGELKVAFNGELVYEEFIREEERAAIRLLEILPKIRESILVTMARHDFLVAFLGRKIYWRDTPAIITQAYPSGLIIKADGAEWPRPPHMRDVEPYEETIKVDILDPYIWRRYFFVLQILS